VIPLGGVATTIHDIVCSDLPSDEFFAGAGCSTAERLAVTLRCNASRPTAAAAPGASSAAASNTLEETAKDKVREHV
jgi:hypothetical protein